MLTIQKCRLTTSRSVARTQDRVWEEHRVRLKFLRSPELVSGRVLIAHA
jgi:hypothetical protein